MKIVVLAGSPKGEVSVTMQYVEFLRRQYPAQQFAVHQIAQRIQKIESDVAAFDEIIAEVRASDGVLWAAPLYYCLVAGQYKRFIELVFERGAQDAFAGKYAAALTTSIHFFDHTAQAYLRAVSDDLNMRFVVGFSPAMYDLVSRVGRRRTLAFADRFFEAIAAQTPTTRAFAPLPTKQFTYRPGPAAKPVDTQGKKVVVLHDATEADSNLGRMVARLAAAFDRADVVNIHEVDLQGGCLGCLQCAYDNHCVYEGRDGLIDCYRTRVLPADIVVFAGTMRDRYLSARWKMFFDRGFFQNHVPWGHGKQFAFLVAGPLAANANLREILVGWTELEQASLVDIVTDEDPAELDRLLDALAVRLVRDAVEEYSSPPTFLGVGGKKIFRDAVFGDLRFVFQADHRYYKSHGLYDFPNLKIRQRLFNTGMMLAMRLPGFRRRFYHKEIKPGMLQPFKRALSLPSRQGK